MAGFYSAVDSLGVAVKNGIAFSVNPKASEALVIGVVNTAPGCFEFHELPWDYISENGKLTTGHYDLVIPVEDMGKDDIRQIKTFKDRI